MTDRDQTDRHRPDGLRGDAALLVRLSEGDEVAFDTILRAYGDGLIRYASRVTSSPDLAQDIVQDVFLHLWDHRSEVKPDWDIAAYLYGRTRNQSLNSEQSLRSAANREERWGQQRRIDTDSASYIDEFSDEATSIRIDVWNALAQTSPRCREIFMLVWDRQLPYAEIAHSLGLSEPTVRNYVSRALKTLSEVLGPRYRKGK